ncbi:amphi-Trp domain-containing protein [Desulfonatronospira sp.]|uniref:amphi-Trp domain-containing protein n=1 Tax=Desulfonatronospira sp. TaxID=1962951 RepID=UPI0025C08CD1|nr:amphi-Trp domain-containing protein [Desulfonatronospira sp.]
MRREKRFFLESLQDRETICKYLDALKEGFQQGEIHFSSKEELLNLEPCGLIKFIIKARKKDGEITLDLSFKWAEDESSPEYLEEPCDYKQNNVSKDG